MLSVALFATATAMDERRDTSDRLGVHNELSSHSLDELGIAAGDLWHVASQ